jgi:hypothetical protein
VRWSKLQLWTEGHANSNPVIDYTSIDLLKAIPHRSINFIVDTTSTGLSLVSLLLLYCADSTDILASTTL